MGDNGKRGPILYVNLNPRHNYAKKLKKLIETGSIPPFVGLKHLMIYHDDWCEIHRGGFCNCDPDFELLH